MLDPRTVIWATGFGVDYSYVDAPVFSDDGAVVHTRGVTAAPGLYFLGMPWQHTRGAPRCSAGSRTTRNTSPTNLDARDRPVDTPDHQLKREAATTMTITTVAGLLMIAVAFAFNAAFALSPRASIIPTSCGSRPPTSSDSSAPAARHSCCSGGASR